MPHYPENKLAQLLIQYLVHAEVETVVISPGSRNAPLIIGLNGSDSINTLSVVDERSAGFFALGIAQQTQKPVVLICTSGSALLNYYPAVAEAFYSDIPLIVVSADRPEHLIDIGDGQTIRQDGVFDRHIAFSANLSEEVSEINKNLIKKAIKASIVERGPVHINVPFDEPLYGTVPEKTVWPIEKKEFSIADEEPLNVNEFEAFASIWNNSEKKLVLVGAHFPDRLLQVQLEHLLKDPSVLVMIENTANVVHNGFINSIDKLIFPFEMDEMERFQPDILLSLGGMIVSKKIKQHLRKFPPKYHWHVDRKRAFDTFHCLSHHFKISTTLFFSQFFFLTKPVQSDYQSFWLQKKKLRVDNHNSYLSTCDFSDLKVFKLLMETLPEKSHLQLSNSSVIRYSQLFDLKASVKVFCNRGASGIDGSTSTAVGGAYATEGSTVFITGDISFFYDSNGLWNSNIPNSFRIILINNGGGGIFRFIPGPMETDALDYFETPHNLSAEHLCKMYAIDFIKATSQAELEEQLKSFYNTGDRPKLLEIETPRQKNDLILKSYFKALKS